MVESTGSVPRETTVDKTTAMKRSGACEQSSMGLYLRELRRIPLLSAEEEQACAQLAALGDEKARQRLIQANLRFVILVAKRYRSRGVPMEDLVNEGNIGLIRAVGRFDPDRGIRFVTYAVHWIRQAILKAIRENGSMIRVPRSRLGELPRTAALRVQAAQQTLSLDSPAPGMDDTDSFAACLEDRNAPKPEEVLVGASLKDELGSVLAGLSAREASIVRYRFGLGGNRRASLLEAGRRHGISKERVRQIEKKVLRRIRASDSAGQLMAYAS
jgi:RNA polymerase primary sigma factor